MALGCIVPVIVAFAMNPAHWDMHGDWWLALNPLGPIYGVDSRGLWSDLQQQGLIISSVWSAVMILLNLRWLGKQISVFRPLNEDAPDDAPGAPVEVVTETAPTHSGAPTDG